MTLFLLYVWLKLNTITGIFLLIGGLSIAGILIAVVSSVMNYSMADDYKSGQEAIDAKAVAKEYIDYWLKKSKIFVPIGIALIVIGNLIPSQREGAYLIAGYAGLKLAETPEMTKLAELVRLKVGNYLDDELQKAKADAVKGVASAVNK